MSNRRIEALESSAAHDPARPHGRARRLFIAKASIAAFITFGSVQAVLSQVETRASVYSRAVEAYRSGQIPLAIETFERALALNESDVDVLLYLGMAHTRLGQNADAVVYLERARQASPSYWDVRVALARAYVGVDQDLAALDELAVVLVAVPDHIDALHLKARIDNRIVASLPGELADEANYDDLTTALEQGMAAYRIGDAQRAEDAFEYALELSPDNVDALLFLGTVYSWRKRFDDALGLLSRARELDPSYVDVAIAIARVNLWQGKLEAARDEIQAILLDAPGRVDALDVRDQIEEKMAAVALAARAVAPAPAPAVEVEPEEEVYEPAGFEPELPEPTPVAVIRADRVLRDPSLEPELRTSAQVPPVVAAFNQGMDAYHAQDVDNAISAFERVLAEDATHVDARLFLGIMLGRNEQYERALDELRVAQRVTPEYPDVDVAIARILMFQGELDEASTHVDRVLRVFPDHDDALTVRRQIRRSRGTKWRADVAYEVSTFDSPGRADWEQSSLAISYKPSKGTFYTVSLIEEDRGYASDQMTVANAYKQIDDDWGAGVQIGVTSSPDFKEDWHVAGSVRHRVRRGRPELGEHDIGDSWINLEVREARYFVGNVSTVKLGFEQYLMANRVWLTGQGILVFDENGDHLPGWLVRADMANGPLQFFAGVADAPETEFGETVDTRSFFTGLVWSLSDRYALRLAYTHEDREDRYVRKAVTSVLTAEF